MADDPLDIEQHDALVAYLRDTGRIAPDESPRVRTLAGGVSNRTVLVERPSGEAWVLKQALPKLRVAVDWFSDPARIRREAEGLRWLSQLAPAGTITPLVFGDPDRFLLAMQAVPQPHENWKTMLLDGRILHDHFHQFGRLLGEIHRRSHEARDELAALFEDRSFFESLRVEPYYEYSATQVPEAAPFLRRLIEDTRGRLLALVHGDYSPKNVLISGGRLVLLDHEVIHWGDPAFDLGFSLTHLLSKAHHLPDKRDGFVHAVGRYWDAYRQELGEVVWSDSLERFAVRHTLGCLLARAAGRSPLEYMDDEARRRQREAVVGLMGIPPVTVRGLARLFIESIRLQEGDGR